MVFNATRGESRVVWGMTIKHVRLSGHLRRAPRPDNPTNGPPVLRTCQVVGYAKCLKYRDTRAQTTGRLKLCLSGVIVLPV